MLGWFVMIEKVYKQLPFPYFEIDEHFKILSSSLPYKEDNFQDLLISPWRISFSQLMDGRERISMDLKIHRQIRSYIVYIVPYSNELVHLFCFPDEQSQAQKNTIGAAMAHEIRNPLTTVKGFLQLLRPQLSKSGKENYADIAINEINRANDLIYEFLNTEKPHKNEKGTVLLNKLAEEIYMLFESKAILHNVSTQLNRYPEDIVVFGNEQQLKQVLLNICNNALEAMDKQQGRICISLDVEEENAKIIIQDNGIGMSPDTIEQLFTIYYSTKVSGTGLGLSISKQIIDKHDGHLSVSSIEGEGAIFAIQLPLHKKISVN